MLSRDGVGRGGKFATQQGWEQRVEKKKTSLCLYPTELRLLHKLVTVLSKTVK